MARASIWVDPGIGFGKTTGHNLFLLRHLRELRILDAPVVVGTSRKRFLGELAGGRPPKERLPGTLASNGVAAVLGGADVVRVHDVAEVREALAVADAVARAREGGSAWLAPAAVAADSAASASSWRGRSRKSASIPRFGVTTPP